MEATQRLSVGKVQIRELLTHEHRKVEERRKTTGAFKPGLRLQEKLIEMLRGVGETMREVSSLS